MSFNITIDQLLILLYIPGFPWGPAGPIGPIGPENNYKSEKFKT